VVEKRDDYTGARPVVLYGPGAEVFGVAAVRKLDNISVSQPLRCTSRERREGEQHGREYEFVPLAEMERRLSTKELVEVGKYKVGWCLNTVI